MSAVREAAPRRRCGDLPESVRGFLQGVGARCEVAHAGRIEKFTALRELVERRAGGRVAAFARLRHDGARLGGGFGSKSIEERALADAGLADDQAGLIAQQRRQLIQPLL